MNSSNQIQSIINDLSRQESGKMVAVLTKIFGTDHIEMAEDVVQDAFVKALEYWRKQGVPDYPKAWLYRTAKNRAIDIIRKNKHDNIIDFSDPKKQLLTSNYTLQTTMDSFWEDKHIKDDFLGMMYACCHPDISPENQITFILKILCGFSTKEIARSFITTEDTISKRLYRTKEYFREHKIYPKIPSADKISNRTETVLGAIYLLFNEGYSATHSNQLIRKDLIQQAMILCKSLLLSEQIRLPSVYALMSLMCFQAARVDSRLTQEGELILLPKQDRTIWNKILIKSGEKYLNEGAFGKSLSTYHLEAAIAYHHCTAKSYKNTDWTAILKYYDMLLNIKNDPIVFLNRCLVILELKGPKAALKLIKSVPLDKILEKYYLYYAALGEIYQRLGYNTKAVSNYEKAVQLTYSKQEILFLKSKIASVLN